MNYQRMWYDLKKQLLESNNEEVLLMMTKIEVQAASPSVVCKEALNTEILDAVRGSKPPIK